MKASLARGFAAALVGGEDVLAGRAKTPSGVSAKGRVLTLKLTKRDPRFLELMELLVRRSPEPARGAGRREGAALERQRRITSPSTSR